MKTLGKRDTLKRWYSTFNQVVSNGLMSAFSNDPDFNDGLSFFVRASYYNRGATPVLIPDTLVTLADNATNIVYLDATLNAEQITSVVEGDLPTSLSVQLYRVTTVSGQITSIEDIRSWIQIAPSHLDYTTNLNAENAHPQYELAGALGNVLTPMMNLPLKKPNDAKALNGDFEYVCESPATYINSLGKVVKTAYHTGSLTEYDSDARSIIDSTKSFSDLKGYVIYLTDGTNEAYRWVEVNDATKVAWTKPIGFEPTSYKISKPRFEREGLLIEGYSQNKLLYSEEFNNAAWTKSSATISAEAIAAPDATVTAEKLIEDSTLGGHYVSQSVTITDGAEVTISVFVKPAERTWFQIYTSLTTNSSAGTWFDLANGVIGTQGHNNATITKLSNGWYRCSVTELDTVGDTSLITQFGVHTSDGETLHQGDGTSGLYIWGTQLEEKPFSSSYIPTTSSASSRASLWCGVRFHNNHSALKDGNFSVVLDAKTHNVPFASDRILLTAGYSESGVDLNHLFTVTANTTILAYYRDDVPDYFTARLDAITRYGMTVDDSNNVTLYERGDKLVTNTRALQTLGANPSKIGVGVNINEGNGLEGHIANIKIYDKVLSDDEMRIA